MLWLQINAGNIGDLTKIRLEHEALSASPAWRCDYVKVSNSSTGEELMLYVDRWFAEEKDDGQTVREIAVTDRPNQMPLPSESNWNMHSELHNLRCFFDRQTC